MIHIRTQELYLILLGIYGCQGNECSGSNRTLTMATNINSNRFHEYLRYLHCQTDYTYDTWHMCASECFKNTTCVGILSATPFAICTRSYVRREQSVPIDDLWLMPRDIEEFGKLIYVYMLK